jgi:catalase-peroxidase
MTRSQDWWPADYRALRPVLHPHGVAQRRHLPHVSDGRGGAVRGRSASRRSTAGPTTATSTRRAGCSGRSSRSTATSLSWADLMVLAGNCALESMGFKTFGFAGGRADVWEPEGGRLLGRREANGSATSATAAIAISRIRWRRADGPHLREPRRPERQARSARSAQDIRETFARMAMNDEETVALIAGGHTFGKAHGAGDPRATSARARRRADRGAGPRLEEQLRYRQGRRHHHERPRRRVDADADQVGQRLLRHLFGYEWELVKSPAGAHQWKPTTQRKRPPCRTRTTRRSARAR